jgi:hypothetical protein
VCWSMMTMRTVWPMKMCYNQLTFVVLVVVVVVGADGVVDEHDEWNCHSVEFVVAVESLDVFDLDFACEFDLNNVH